LIDESGFLLSPLVRRTLAPRGKTPILKTKARYREKVSITAALTLSPRRHRLGLYWRTHPKSFVNAERTADFLRALMRRLHGAVIVVWDRGTIHSGEPIQQLLHDFPRLTLERLPPYAPDLNPVEYLWSHLKYGRLANFVPDDIFDLNAVLGRHLLTLRKVKHFLSVVQADWQTRLFEEAMKSW
jgi:transposase